MNIGLKASLIRRAWSLNNEHYSGTTPCLDVHNWCLETGFFNLLATYSGRFTSV
jgi:hypothetical protein